jgi:hypothetical protein
MCSSASSQGETLKLKWTAYDGLSTGPIDIPVEVLPSILTTSSGDLKTSLDGGQIPISGSATWTLDCNGNQSYTGSVTTELGLDYIDFTFTYTSDYVGSKDGQPVNFSVQYSGSTSHTASWHESSFDPNITDAWPGLLDGGFHHVLDATYHL